MQNVKRLVLFHLDQLWQRRWMALIFAWVVCLLGWSLVAFLPDRYTSQARFYVDTMSLLNPLLRGISVDSDDRTREQEVGIMQRTLTSRPNLAKVVQMTDLDTLVRDDSDLQELIDSLETRITLSSQATNLFQVDFTDNSPAMARDVVQALLTIFIENSTGDKREDIQSARAFIETQIKEYEKQLREAEARLADFKVKNLEFISSNSQSYAQRLEQAGANVKALRLEHEDLEAQRDQIKSGVSGTPRFLSVDGAPVMVGGGGGTVTPTRVARIRLLQQRLDELRLQYTEKHPDVVRLKQVLNELIAQEQGKPARDGVSDYAASSTAQVPNELYSELALRQADLEAKMSSVKRRLQEAESVLGDLQRRASDAPRVEAEYTNLNRDYEVLRANYESLLQRRESARIAQAADSTTDRVEFRLIAAPELPANPVGPPRALFNSLVLLIGMGAGIGFAVLLAQIDERVTAPEDLLEFPNFRVLGCVSQIVKDFRQRAAFLKEARRFSAVAAGLGVIFMVFLIKPLNLSALPQTIAMRGWL